MKHRRETSGRHESAEQNGFEAEPVRFGRTERKIEVIAETEHRK